MFKSLIIYSLLIFANGRTLQDTERSSDSQELLGSPNYPPPRAINTADNIKPPSSITDETIEWSDDITTKPELPNEEPSRTPSPPPPKADEEPSRTPSPPPPKADEEPSRTPSPPPPPKPTHAEWETDTIKSVDYALNYTESIDILDFKPINLTLDACYSTCKIHYAMDESNLSKTDIKRLVEGRDIILSTGEVVSLENQPEIVLPNQDTIEVNGDTVVRMRGNKMVNMNDGKPFKLSDDNIEKLQQGDKIRLENGEVVRLVDDEVIRVHDGVVMYIKDEDRRSLIQGAPRRPENNTVTRFDFKKEDIEKLTNGEVITHENEDIRLLDGEIIRISDWEKIPISDEDKINIIESEEGKCIHLCEMDGDYCIKECKDDSLCMSDCASKTVDGFYDFNSEESSGINMFSLSVSGIIIALHC